jgi:GNAT superfamily N-acetyltransferase
VIELTEEPYDGDVAGALVRALLADLNVRYVAAGDGLTADELAAADLAYLAEVTADLVARPKGSFVVAWVDGVAIGCGALKPLRDHDGVGEVKRMFTHPAARRQGISRRLLRRLEAIATELGYSRLQLETGVEQPEALALYESEGWHAIDPYGRYRQEPTSRCYAKDLTS